MLFCIRDGEQNYDYCSGSCIATDGKATAIPREQIRMQVLAHSTIAGTKYPRRWKIDLPDSNPAIIESITTVSLNRLSTQYWDGRAKATEGFEGLGYAELAGY
jgi:predicted secreted hydrolase